VLLDGSYGSGRFCGIACKNKSDALKQQGGAKTKGHSDAREAAGSPAASAGGEYQVERVLKKLWKPTSKSGGARGDEAPTKIKLSGGLVPCYATPKPGDRAFYLVKWVGYDNPSDNSWEPCANLCIEGEYNQVAIDYERQHAEPEDLSGARESQPIRCLRFNSPDPPQFEYIPKCEGEAVSWRPAAGKVLTDYAHVLDYAHEVDGNGKPYLGGRLRFPRDVVYEPPPSDSSAEAAESRVVTNGRMPPLEVFHADEDKGFGVWSTEKIPKVRATLCASVHICHLAIYLWLMVLLWLCFRGPSWRRTWAKC